MDAALERLVRRRAGGRCEYCRLPQSASGVPFEIDHIIARKHKGRTSASNLAETCIYCNGYKGPCIAGRDPLTAKLAPRPRFSAHPHGLLFARTGDRPMSDIGQRRAHSLDRSRVASNYAKLN